MRFSDEGCWALSQIRMNCEILAKLSERLLQQYGLDRFIDIAAAKPDQIYA
jgi:hypothetical protein